MTREMKKILFTNTRKLVIEEGSLSAPNNVLMALTVNKNIQAYGMTLDASAIRALSTQTVDEMARTWKEIDTILSDVTGAADFKGELFYPNFPEEVMAHNEAELYLNSLFYYSFSQTNSELVNAIAEEIRNAVSEDKKERLPLLEEFPRELVIINKGTEDDLFKLMDARMHSLNMSEHQLEELLAFSRAYREKFDEMLGNDTKFQSKESKVKIAMILHEQGRDSELKYLLKDGVDVLRFAAMLSKNNGITYNNVELKPLNSFYPIAFKLKKDEKRLIRNLLNECKNLYSDVWRQEKIFKALINRLGTTEKDHCPERVIKAFDNLAKGRKLDENGEIIHNPGRELPAAIDAVNHGDFKPLSKIAKARPGEFLRSYISIVEKTNPEYRDHVIGLVKNCIDSDSIPMKNLLTIKGQIDIKEKELASDEPAVKVYKHHGKYFVQESKKTSLPVEDLHKMKEALLDTASSMVAGYQNLGKVYIDPALSNIKAPGRDMRSASGGSVLTPYSTIDMDKNKNIIILGVRWERLAKNPNDPHIDVDLSAHMYTGDYRDKGYISYSRLKHTCGVHSGDYTSVGQSGSSTEAIFLDKSKLKANSIRYVVAEVHCYNISSFKEAGNCKFVYEQKEGKMDNASINGGGRNDGRVTFMGEVFEPTQLENCIMLNSSNSTTIPFVYDVEEDRIHWLDNGLFTPDMVRNTENPYVMSSVVSEVEISRNNPYPDMKTLFECYAKNNGEIVSDITQADTVFVKGTVDREELGISEDARIVTSYDLDVISKEFSGNDDQSMNVVEPEPEKKETTEKEEPALIKQLRYFHDKLETFPRGFVFENEMEHEDGSIEQSDN